MDFNADCNSCRVYCAGPIFNRSEREEMTAIADALGREGFPVYLPHRDGMEFRCVLEVLVGRGWSRDLAGELLHAAIFALDIYQLIIECNAVAWNLNGRTPDEGAVSEAAIAWALGKPLVAYSDDVRSLIKGRTNPLLAGLVDWVSVDRIEEIPPAVAEAIERQGVVQLALPELAPKLRRAIDDGRRLWEKLCSENARLDDEVIADVVTELFGAQFAEPNVSPIVENLG